MSRALIEKTVLDYQRAQAAGDGEAGCDLLTEEARKQSVESDRRLTKAIGVAPADTCEEVIARFGSYSGTFREALLNTQIDSVSITGEQAKVTVHSSATRNGVLQEIPPSTLPLSWEDGRWLVRSGS